MRRRSSARGDGRRRSTRRRAASSAGASKKNLRLGLDVFAGEPDKGSAPFEAKILERAISVATPHVGASTDQAQRAIAAETARIIRSFLTEETVPNVVNICATSPARY